MLRQQMDASTEQLLQRHMLAGSAVGTDWWAFTSAWTPAHRDCCLRVPQLDTSWLCEACLQSGQPVSTTPQCLQARSLEVTTVRAVMRDC